ncbi:MAG: lactate utilization protein [Bacillota bacterium]|nr:lactate utilization protein [Bacillota bacterium]
MPESYEPVLEALRKNNFDACFAVDSNEACLEVLKRIPENAPVGIGGSLTVSQIGLADLLAEHNLTIHNQADGKSKEEIAAIKKKANSCEVYISGINALTEDGKLVYMDGSGNRVSAIAYGPSKVITICGVNKIVKNIDEGLQRIRDIAGPANAKRLNYNTPCAKTGKCEDCSSPQRICNIFTVIQKKPMMKDFSVILVDQELGL